jgi:hypothetical protein
MTNPERLEWLLKEVDNQVKQFGKDSARHKKAALRLKIASVVLAAFITILLGLRLQNEQVKTQLSNVALVFGGFITIFSAYEAFFEPRALWIRETIVCVRLKDLQRDLKYWVTGREASNVDTQTIDAFKARLDRILDHSLKNWMTMRGATEPESSASATEKT